MKPFILFISLTLAASFVHAQLSGFIVDRNLVWHSAASTEYHSNEDVNAAFSIVTQGNVQVQLIYGSETFTFPVSEIIGDWNDLSIDGSFKYRMVYQGKSGEITIERFASNLSILKDFTQADAAAMHRRFIIDQVEVQ